MYPTRPLKKTLTGHGEIIPRALSLFLQDGDVPPGGKELAQYLAKYVVSPPISVRRIENYDGETVSYWYRDHKTGQIKHETLPALQFIGRMTQHILPKGFQRIRYYGLHGNVRYQKMREYLAEIIPPQTTDDPTCARDYLCGKAQVRAEATEFLGQNLSLNVSSKASEKIHCFVQNVGMT